MTRRALLVCPGRGSYTADGMGQLQARRPAASALIDACDAYRAAHGQPTVRELDAAERFSGARHVAGEHASLLTFACSVADAADLSDKYEVVGVAGNSMGFYTALAVSGALSTEDAIALVDTMGRYQTRNVLGGQLLYPLADASWAPDPALERAVQAAIDSSQGEAFWSIRLGSTAVLGGTDAGLRHLQQTLPALTRGARSFPMKLPLHSAFHTPVMADTAARAQAELAHLAFQAPRLPLASGHGDLFRPRWADPAALRAYTLGAQVTEPYDFGLSVHTALAHTGADVVIALGPGNALGGPLASVLVNTGWRGLRSRADFEAVQESDEPVLLSFGLPAQREQLV